MDLYSSTIIHYHLNVIQDLLRVMMDNNARMLRYVDNMENTLSTSSKAILDAPVHSDVIVSLDDKCESEEVSALLITTESEADFDLDKGFSSPLENSENNDSSRNACKVVVEITGKEIGMEAVDFVTNSSVSPKTQMFDEMFQLVFIVKYAYSHLVMFDDQLAQPCMIIASSHDQPIGRILPFDPGSRLLIIYLGGTRNCALCDVLCTLAPDILMASTLWKRLLRGKGILLVESLAFFPETVATASGHIFRAIFHESVGVGIDKFVQQWGVTDVQQYSSNGLRTATYTVYAIWSSVEEGDVIAATLKLYPPRIYDSTWVAAAGMKKKKHNGNHSWDYTMLHERQIWNPYADIALVSAKLDRALYFLKIRVLTQNILSDTWCFSVVIFSGVINCGSRNTSNLPGIALDIGGALKLHHFPFALVSNLYIVTLGGTVLVLCIWDPGINPKTMNLNGHTETLETQLLPRSTSKFCLCAHSASMTRVWDPGRQRDISSHSTELATRAAIFPWRKRLIVLLLALPAESNGMLGRMDDSVSTLYSRRAFATFVFEPENMDMVEKWLGKASMLQSKRSTGAKDFKVTMYYVLARSKGNNIIQQLQKKTNVGRSSGQQDVATVGEIAKSQSIGWNTSNSSLHQEVQVHDQLHCAKLDKNMSRITVDSPRFPFDPGGLLNLDFNSKQKRSDTRVDSKISMLLYLNLEDKVLIEDGVLL